MANPNKITVNGDLGSGKSQLVKKMAAFFNLQILSVGNFFREEAKQRNMEFNVLHELMLTDDSIDRAIDARQKKYLVANSDYIVDSRLGAIFEPNAFKILLTVDELVGAQRILDDIEKNPNRSVEAAAKLIQDVLKRNQHRVASELARYDRLYHVNHLDPVHYNLVISTNDRTEEQVFQIAEMAFAMWLKGIVPRKMNH